MRPQYEERVITTSRATCPFCGGRRWVDFGVRHTYSSEEAWALRAAIGNSWADIGMAVRMTDPGYSIAECVACGAVMS